MAARNCAKVEKEGCLSFRARATSRERTVPPVEAREGEEEEDVLPEDADAEGAAAVAPVPAPLPGRAAAALLEMKFF